MNFLRRLGRKLRGPGWYVWNILAACWRFNLRDMADRPGQKPWKRVAYKLVISVETLIESVVLAFILVGGALGAALFFCPRYAFIEWRDLWRDR